jgi:hypothetical protein
MTQFSDGLDAIRTEIRQAGADFARPQTLADTTIERLTEIIHGLRAVPVDVEIKVVPVQDNAGTIKDMAGSSAPIDIAQSVKQGD